MNIKDIQMISVSGRESQLRRLGVYLRGTPGKEFNADLAYLVLVADTLLTMGLEELMVVEFIMNARTWLFKLAKVPGTQWTLSEKGLNRNVAPVLQILDGNYVLTPAGPGATLYYSLRESEWVDAEVVKGQVPLVSVALNVGQLWHKALTKSLDLDSEEEASPADGTATPSSS